MKILATLLFVLGTMGSGPVGRQPVAIKPSRQVMRLPAYLLCLPGEVVERAGAKESREGPRIH